MAKKGAPLQRAVVTVAVCREFCVVVWTEGGELNVEIVCLRLLFLHWFSVLC